MKKKLIFIWLLMLGTLTSCQSCSSEYKNVNEIIVEELHWVTRLYCCTMGLIMLMVLTRMKE